MEESEGEITDISNEQQGTIQVIWTQKHVDILREWKAKCFVYLWLHDKSTYYYTCLQNYLSYPVIIFSSVASFTLLSSTNIVARYVMGSLSLCSSIFTSILRHLKPGELLQKHMYFTRKYHSLIRTIDAILSLDPPMRPTPDIFIDKIGNEIDMILANQVDAPIAVIREFENKYGSLACILYGDDIIELIRSELATNKMFNKYSTLLKTGVMDTQYSDRRNASIDLNFITRNNRSFDIPLSRKERVSIDIIPNHSNRSSCDERNTPPIHYNMNEIRPVQYNTSNTKIPYTIYENIEQ